ncbi:MAG: hypothetical protein U5J78_07650 [Parasphingorhabdus sp.]|nr:hypothetical protein [Parasphingorhabdus sp.]
METLYDWLSVLVFAGLITLFLQRSSQDEPSDTIWQYLPPSVGCAAANYVGNEYDNLGWLAIAMLVGVGVYIHLVLKPFGSNEAE